jgi:hypothetical protein
MRQQAQRLLVATTVSVAWASAPAAYGTPVADRAARTAHAYVAALTARNSARACQLVSSFRDEPACPAGLEKVSWSGPRLSARWTVHARSDGSLIRIDVTGRSQRTGTKVRDVLWARTTAPARLLKLGRLLPLSLGFDADDPQLTSRPLTDGELGPAKADREAVPCQADQRTIDDPAGDVENPLDGSAAESTSTMSIDVRSLRASVESDHVQCVVIELGAPPQVGSGLLLGTRYRTGGSGSGIFDLGKDLLKSYVFFGADGPVISPRLPHLAVAITGSTVAISLPPSAVSLVQKSHITVTTYSGQPAEPLLSAAVAAEDHATMALSGPD